MGLKQLLKAKIMQKTIRVLKNNIFQVGSLDVLINNEGIFAM